MRCVIGVLTWAVWLVLGCAGAAAAPCAALQTATGTEMAKAGWTPSGLARLEKTATRLHSAALMVVAVDKIVLSYGAVERPYPVRSIRKSLLSAMLGQLVAEKKLRLDQPLSSFKIAAFSRLTAEEKTATVFDLMGSRSGIYLPAAAETEEAAGKRPHRGAHKPGAHWFYNNWDFNTLGAIFETVEGQSIFTAFEGRIAKPACMTGYRSKLGAYDHGGGLFGLGRYAIPAYHFRLNAQDLARFGLLYLNAGRASGQQVVQGEWVKDSTRAMSETNEPAFDGYSLMWWVTTGKAAQKLEDLGVASGLPTGSFAAAGYGGQWLIVIPEWKSVIVHLTDTGGLMFHTVLNSDQRLALLRAILDARKP